MIYVWIDCSQEMIVFQAHEYFQDVIDLMSSEGKIAIWNDVNKHIKVEKNTKYWK